MERFIKARFSVIGLEGSTEEGPGFVQRLWNEANGRFAEIASLAKKDEAGSPVGVWGAMTDFTRSFKPWDDYKRGLYLAGVEVEADAVAPEGWTKWTVPGFDFLAFAGDASDAFQEGLAYMKAHALPLAGAAQDFTDPVRGMSFVLFPIRRLED